MTTIQMLSKVIWVKELLALITCTKPTCNFSSPAHTPTTNVALEAEG